MPSKFLWPWVVLELDIPELNQDPEAKKVSSSCGRYNKHTFVEYPLLMQGDVEISRTLYGASEPKRCRGGVYGTRSEESVSGPEKVDRLRARQPNPIARIWGSVSSFVGRVCTRRIQRVTPDPYLLHHFEFYSVCSTKWPRPLHATRLCHARH